jgi:hypothetical protein
VSATPATIQRIACTECHRDMRIEMQHVEPYNDSVIVAAECDCGRIMGEVDGLCIKRFELDGKVPLIAAASTDVAGEIGRQSATQVARLRDRIAVYERRIAAATWVSAKPRKAAR